MVGGDGHGELERPFIGLVGQDAGDDCVHAGITGHKTQIGEEGQFVKWLTRTLVACDDRPRPPRQIRKQTLHLFTHSISHPSRPDLGILLGFPAENHAGCGIGYRYAFKQPINGCVHGSTSCFRQ